MTKLDQTNGRITQPVSLPARLSLSALIPLISGLTPLMVVFMGMFCAPANAATQSMTSPHRTRAIIAALPVVRNSDGL